jgi:small nuclear ribonucleoprotein (snRNP)-like protein
MDTTRNMHDHCVKLMYHHVVITMNDGKTYDGIIESVDGNNMSVLVGEDVPEQADNGENNRQFDLYGGYNDYGYGRPRRRFRRYRRRRFPFPYVVAVSLLPYLSPYPYYPYY